MKTGSITGSTFNNSRKGGGGDLHFVEKKKCVLKVSETCEIKPKEGKWIHVNYGLEIVQPGEYLQPMLLNTIVEPNLYELKYSPTLGSRKTPAIYIINTNDFFVQLKRGQMFGTVVWLRANNEGGEEVLTCCRNCCSCSSSSPSSSRRSRARGPIMCYDCSSS